jgi:hypothetical protein
VLDPGLLLDFFHLLGPLVDIDGGFPTKTQGIELFDTLFDDSHGSFLANAIGTILTALCGHPSSYARGISFSVAKIVVVFQLLEHGLPADCGGDEVSFILV